MNEIQKSQQMKLLVHLLPTHVNKHSNFIYYYFLENIFFY